MTIKHDLGKAENPLEKLITINVFGQNYTFRAGQEVEDASAIAKLLEDEIRKLANQKDGNLTEMNKLTILISIALNMANENINLKNRQYDLMQNLSKKSANLARMLDAAA